ncbi:hypothetical protein [uncultured Maribacter sp.]|uniref:toxin-antitoxin system YwqK family antitoxin n=1 Tax=uncultured Maribacter sp. TaxID=431308 RepID=UPI0026173FD0|nr:hypothetical protein [uncultured Maribacter sp.]
MEFKYKVYLLYNYFRRMLSIPLGLGFFIFLNLLSCKSSLEVPTDRKIISDREFKEDFFVTDKTPKPKGKRLYHWYKSQEIYASQNNYAGELLDGPYIKHYYSNQLAEKGDFSNGIKRGHWTSWHKNGMVAQVSKWKKGRLSGKYITRDSLGSIKSSGAYKNGYKTGTWIYPIQGDTMYFVKGTKIITDTTITDSLRERPFFKRIFMSKRQRIEQGVVRPKKENREKNVFKRIFKKKPKEENQVNNKGKKIEAEEKPNFFQRIFKKKNKKENGAKQKISPNNVKQTNKSFKIKKERKKQKKEVTKKKKINKGKKEPNFFQRLFKKKNKEQTEAKE